MHTTGAGACSTTKVSSRPSDGSVGTMKHGGTSELDGWPPQLLGDFPQWNSGAPFFDIQNLDLEKNNGSHLKGISLIYPTGTQQTNMLLKIWSPEITRHQGPSLMRFLKLPDTAVDGSFSSWLGLVDTAYPSDRFFIRESYEIACQRLFEFEAAAPIQKVDNSGLLTVKPLLVAGSSGIGKSFFAMYFIWRLFHPDGVYVHAIPDTIIYKPQPDNDQAHVYHRGYFYSCPNMLQWINTVEAKGILDFKNAWVIVDGPIAISRFCRFLVVTSPGNLKSFTGKQLRKKTGSQVFLPPLDS